jgi:hypothetical protein
MQTMTSTSGYACPAQRLSPLNGIETEYFWWRIKHPDPAGAVSDPKLRVVVGGQHAVGTGGDRKKHWGDEPDLGRRDNQSR